jgi:hypothetical protein
MLVDSDANALLNLVLGTSGLLPATVYIGLLTAQPNSNGTGVTEPSGFGYARVAVANNATEWPNAVGRVKVHANNITFPAAAGGNWGTIVWAGVFDAAVAGNLRAAAALSVARVINDTDQFRFLAASSPFQITHPFL